MLTRVITLSMMVALAPAAAARTGTTQSGATAAQAEAAKPKALAALQGTWILTSADGEDLTGAPEIAVTITNDQYVQTLGGDVVERGRLKIDDTKTPLQVDLIILEGNDAGKTQLGVLEVKGTALRGKLNSPGDSVRPTDFEPADGFFTFAAAKK